MRDSAHDHVTSFAEVRRKVRRRDVLIGGGTALVPLMRDGLVVPRTVVDRWFPALAVACDGVGTTQLRNMATLGGNLCQRIRCWYFRQNVPCHKTGGRGCPAVAGLNEYLAIFGGGPCHAPLPSDPAVALAALD
ncbi:MAG: FAD binding domain-containing protein, partial [Gemmatimonadales bacterium]